MQRHSSSDSQAVLLQEIANQRKAIAMLIETCKALSQAMEFRIDDPRFHFHIYFIIFFW